MVVRVGGPFILSSVGCLFNVATGYQGVSLLLTVVKSF